MDKKAKKKALLEGCIALAATAAVAVLLIAGSRTLSYVEEAEETLDPNTVTVYEASVSSSSPYGGNLTVQVAVDAEGVIKSVVVLDDHNATEGIGTRAIDVIPGQIVEMQSTDVENVSGASITSEAIVEAVKQALAQRTE